VEPHHPAGLQQLPNVLPAQVYPFVPPHEPSVETLEVALALAVVVVDEGFVVVVVEAWTDVGVVVVDREVGTAVLPVKVPEL
jgi:hypothetical protein